ncbi:MAG: HlyD family secretion protein [Azospirillaceae bacterium]|nr:HlyD family secretion protein [Azospirillaceae bacterium]
MFAKVIRVAITLATVAVAVFLVAALWRYYMVLPWTRDGRVRAEVVAVASEVAGTVVALPVTDNQMVHKGDVLFQVDPVRFHLALAQAEAELDQRRQERDQRLSDQRRRAGMTGVVSAEEIDRTRNTAGVAGAAFAAAQVAVDIAKLNLERATVHAPVNGFVTNLNLRVGDFMAVGVPRIALVNADRFWVVGYFEETKLGAIHRGDLARIQLMGFEQPLSGHVESIGRGIADPNAEPDGAGLPQVNPVFTWVRLAQRVPVKLVIDRVPEGMSLIAGTTCTVSIGRDALDLAGDPKRNPMAWLQETWTWLREITDRGGVR